MKKDNSLAPIALFVYNRPDHTTQTIKALQQNNLAKDSELFVFCDGPKDEKDQDKVAEVHKVVDAISGFKNITIIKNNSNKGLANSIIAGVSDVIEKCGKAVVLEDDLVVSPHFLQFMNDGLQFYQDDERVISIHGYVYPLKTQLPETFFLRGADCWGWATWKRGWDLFNADGSQLLKQLQDEGLESKFDFDGCYDYTKMLEGQIAGTNNSWAIRWHASAFLADKLTLYPGKSLVQNIGFDDSGTHCGSSDEYCEGVSQNQALVLEILVEENNKVRKEIKKYIKPSKSIIMKLISRIKRKIEKRRLKKLRKKYGWFSTELKWQEIERIEGGYDSQKILEKCKDSLLKVKNGEAVYERDSVVFDKVSYSWPLISALLWAASYKNSELNVLDFGGSLGSSYYQGQKFIKDLSIVKWSVVEQKNFIEVGKKYFEDARLKFYYDIDSCIKDRNPNVLLLSCVLQYLENPYDFIKDIKKYNFEFIIIDRAGFVDGFDDILTIQKVVPDVYEASYPCWFFNKQKFIAAFSEKYQVIEEFEDNFGRNILVDHKIKSQYCGFILRRKLG